MTTKKILYVGLRSPHAPRDGVYIEELKKRGIEFVERVSDAPGFLKFKILWRAMRAVKEEYDLVWVGYLSGMFVPLAYLASRKKIIFNALGSAYEAYVSDRVVCKPYSFYAFLFWFSDFLAFHLSSKILVESESQKRYLSKSFFVPARKFEVIFTGVDEKIFFPDPSVQKKKEFTVVFRGMFIPATGVEFVLEAAKILKDKPIKFLLIGWGQLQDKVIHYLKQNNLKNVELTTVFQDPDELRRNILSAHVMLGQFSVNARLDRTIQHKTTEALALGLPFITRDSVSNRELLVDRENCIFVQHSNAEAIADAILSLKENQELARRIGENARKTYLNHLAPKVLGDSLEEILHAHSW